MAIDPKKKVIGDTPGFVSPQKAVVFNAVKNVQGGQGGANGTAAANLSGLAKPEQDAVSPAQKEIFKGIVQPPTKVAPSIYSPASQKESVAPTQFKAGLNSSPVNPFTKTTSPTSTQQPIQDTPVFKPVDFSKPSISVSASPENQQVFQQAEKTNSNLGAAKGVEYSQDANGNILRKDMNSGSISPLQSRVSSMGSNGSTVSRELRPEEQRALDASSKMINDWNDYKQNQQKEADRANMMNAISRMPPATQASALQRLGIESMKDSTDRAGVAATAENQRIGQELQYKQAAMTANQNAFNQQKDLHTLSREDAKAASEIEGRLQNQRVEGLKLFSKAAESNQPVSTQLGLLRNASNGKLDSSILRSAYSENLKGVTNRAGAIDALKDADISPEDFDQLIRLFQE